MTKLACQALVLTHSKTFFVLLAANPATNNLDAARVLTIATSFGFTIFVLVYIAAAFSGKFEFANWHFCEGLVCCKYHSTYYTVTSTCMCMMLRALYESDLLSASTAAMNMA